MQAKEREEKRGKKSERVWETEQEEENKSGRWRE